MPVYRIPQDLVFPKPELADPSGLLGVGGDLSPERMLLGYQTGIFAWYSEGRPILWWSPDPRFVLFPDKLHIHRSLAKKVRRGDYRITFDQAFTDVVRHCAQRPRPGQDGTWITDAMLAGYQGLFDAGYAHSIEAWSGDELVGGLYGVAVGDLFCGESMFSLAPDASKVAFVHAVAQLTRWGFALIDSQVHTDHLERFGAEEIPRRRYLDLIAPLVRRPGRPGRWSFDPDFPCPA